MGLFAFTDVEAQLTLTKAANCPTIGDLVTLKEYDSTGVVPKATGTGQVWDFSNLTTTLSAYTESYTSVSAHPSASLFPGADLAKSSGTTEVEFMTVGSGTMEFNGFYKPVGPEILSFTNTAQLFTWPVSLGSSGSDAASGALSNGTLVMGASGTISYSATGVGTVILPGPKTHSNCLQVIQTVSLTVTSGTNTFQIDEKRYMYYSSLSKEGIVEYAYTTETTGTVVTKSFEMKMSQEALIAGISANQSTLKDVRVFPNPASGTLQWFGNSDGNVQLIDMKGVVVRDEKNIGSLDISNLPIGIYNLRMINEKGILNKKVNIQE